MKLVSSNFGLRTISQDLVRHDQKVEQIEQVPSAASDVSLFWLIAYLMRDDKYRRAMEILSNTPPHRLDAFIAQLSSGETAAGE